MSCLQCPSLMLFLRERKNNRDFFMPLTVINDSPVVQYAADVLRVKWTTGGTVRGGRVTRHTRSPFYIPVIIIEEYVTVLPLHTRTHSYTSQCMYIYSIWFCRVHSLRVGHERCVHVCLSVCVCVCLSVCLCLSTTNRPRWTFDKVGIGGGGAGGVVYN